VDQTYGALLTGRFSLICKIRAIVSKKDSSKTYKYVRLLSIGLKLSLGYGMR